MNLNFLATIILIISLSISFSSCHEDNIQPTNSTCNCSDDHYKSRWTNCIIQYYVKKYPGAFSEDDMDSITKEAFNQWGHAMGMAFEEESVERIDNIIIIDMIPLTGNSPNNCPGFDKPLALTEAPPVGQNPRVEIKLNEQVDWTVMGLELLKATIIHEIGHALGLRHSCTEESIMHCCPQPGITDLDPLTINTARKNLDIPCVCGRIGASWTYREIGGTATRTIVEEGVDELIGGYKVYRQRDITDPPNLGLYIACDPDHGKIEVATDSWDVFDPSNSEKKFWNPPIFFCQFGDDVGTTCEWNGTFDGETDWITKIVTEVIAYESIVTPFSSFENVMKLKETSYDVNGNILSDPSPSFYWIDKDIGFVRGENVDLSEGIELLEYDPG